MLCDIKDTRNDLEMILEVASGLMQLPSKKAKDFQQHQKPEGAKLPRCHLDFYLHASETINFCCYNPPSDQSLRKEIQLSG